MVDNVEMIADEALEVAADEALQAVTNAQIFAKLCEVERLLQAKTVNEHSREIWGLDEIAAYFGYTKTHTSRSIVTSPRFPRPIDVKGLRGSKSKNKWISGEVVQFCLRWKKK